MDLWNKVSSTDPKFTKRVKLGRYEFCDIDAMWTIQRATELWGPYGSTWGLQNTRFNPLYSKDMGVTAFTLEADFVFPGGRFAIAADLPYDPRGETLKKLQTMCIGKALSRLGFSADVYLGMFDDSAYVKTMENKYAAATDGGGFDNPDPVVSADSQTAVTKSKHKKYPEPNPVASGILGSLAQKYMELLSDPANSNAAGYIVNFKTVCHKVYDKYGQYPTKMESIPKMLEAIPLSEVIEKNDFLDGVE